MYIGPYQRRHGLNVIVMLNSMLLLKILAGNTASDILIPFIRIIVSFKSSRNSEFWYTFHRTVYSLGEPFSKMCADYTLMTSSTLSHMARQHIYHSVLPKRA